MTYTVLKVPLNPNQPTTILVYSPIKITSLFIPFLNFHIFYICSTPLNVASVYEKVIIWK